MALRVAIASDLHLEFGPCNLLPVEADVLILAGDICVASAFSDRDLTFFAEQSSHYKTVLYVVGNHEYYGSEHSAVLPKLRSLEDFNNLHLLENDAYDLDGQLFVGTTLWMDCNKNDSVTKDFLSRSMSDFEVIKAGGGPFTPSHSVSLHDIARSFLDESVLDQWAIVITHHLPSWKSVAPKYAGTPMNYGFVSDLEYLMGQRRNVKLWVHGHTHDAFDYQVGETRVVCNPRGYYSYETWAKDFLPKVVEVF